MIRYFCTAIVAMCATQFCFAAPGPRKSDKPETPATPAQRATAMNNLKMIGLGMHNYHDVFGALPTNTVTKDGKPGLSWRVLLLPYMEEEELYKQFKLDEPWDSKNNIKLLEKIPKVYSPLRGKAEKGQTFLQMFAGKYSLLGEAGKGIRLVDITDGSSNTFMAIEGGTPVDWTKPVDLPFNGKTLPKLGGMFDGNFHVLMGDGSVRHVPKGVDEKVLLYSITRAGGEVVDLEAEIEKAGK